MSVWDDIRNVLLVLEVEDASEGKDKVSKLDAALKNETLNQRYLIFSKNKGEAMEEIKNSTFISLKDFNLLGKTKNENYTLWKKQNWDAIFIIDEMNGKFEKKCKSFKTSRKIAIDNSTFDAEIKLDTNAKEISEKLIFAKLTLSKIF